MKIVARRSQHEYVETDVEREHVQRRNDKVEFKKFEII